MDIGPYLKVSDWSKKRRGKYGNGVSYKKIHNSVLLPPIPKGGG